MRELIKTETELKAIANPASLGLVLNPELAGLAMAFSSVSVLISSLMLNFTKVD